MKGTVKKIISDRGFGFITAEDGKEVFFHNSACVEVDFDSLQEGDSLDFEVEQGPKGPRATGIRKA